MNFKSILSATVLSTMIVGCSSDEPINNNGSQDNDGDGKGYVTLSINLPTVAASRAQSNDQFFDGEASEYKVNHAHLVIFRGENEAGATVTQVYNIATALTWDNAPAGDGNNITTSGKTVQQIQQSPDNNNLWALVVLNDPQAETHFTLNKTFGELTRSEVTPETMYSAENGFLMTNSPLYTATGTVQTLVKLEKGVNVFKSKEEAEKTENATPIHVERAVSKVSVSNAVTTTEGTIDGLNGSDYVGEISGWELDITNKTSYLVRNVGDFGKWYALNNSGRFYSATNKRVYWAIDPNYRMIPNDEVPDEEDFQESSNMNEEDARKYFDMIDDPTKVTLSIDDNAYCLENTFNVANMRQPQTTRVILKVVFKKEGADAAETFYTLGDTKKIYDAAGMRTYVETRANALFDDKEGFKVKIGSSVSESAGEHELSIADITYDVDGVETQLTLAELDRLNEDLGKIYTYYNGECYYPVRIQHFGDTYTSWKPGSPTYGEKVNAEEARGKYLGRYGMVRNNWYEIQVSGIKKLGTPDIPERPNIPDDENEYYLNLQINIHAWAKRVQNVIL